MSKCKNLVFRYKANQASPIELIYVLTRNTTRGNNRDDLLYLSSSL